MADRATIPSTGEGVDLVPSPDRDEVSSGTNKINFAPTVSIEWVQGGPAGDTVKGNDAGNYLPGAGGNDTLTGRRGNDRLIGDIVEFGNNGNDVLNGGPGRDVLNGGPGDDVLFAKDGEADEITCGPGGDVVHADPFLDSRSLDCIDFIGLRSRGCCTPSPSAGIAATGSEGTARGWQRTTV